MADWTFVNLTTAVSGINTTVDKTPQSTSVFTLSPKDGTISVINVSKSSFNITADTIPASPPRRPQTGQVFPRGVYNK
jgi:hypothetical protein